MGAVNNYVNLLQISSGIAIWLGISPPDLFFYAVSVEVGLDGQAGVRVGRADG